MRESIRMGKYDGFLKNSKKIHRTNILPLRWIGNFCEKPANYHLGKFLHYSDHDDYGLACRFHAYASHLLYKPYLKWGTFYRLDIKK